MQALIRLTAFVGTVLLLWGLLPWGTCTLRVGAGVSIPQVGDYADDSVSDYYDGRDRTPSSDVVRTSRATGFIGRVISAIGGCWGRYPVTRNPQWVVVGAFGGLAVAAWLSMMRRVFGPGPKV